MRRTLVVFVMPLAVLVVGSLQKAVSGPPERVGGAMTFDTVADGLRKYRLEKAPERRVRLLEKLAPTRDPRVVVLLGEALEDREVIVWPPPGQPIAVELGTAASRLLFTYYLPLEAKLDGDTTPRKWWKANESQLRRAANLPR